MKRESTIDFTGVYVVGGFLLAWHYNSFWSFGLYLAGAVCIGVFFMARIWEAITREARQLHRQLREYARPPKLLRF